MAKQVRKHIFLGGRVQGVGFRAYLRHQAQKLGIRGWAKNLADGRVEAVFAAEQERIVKMIELAKEGPMLGKVKEIEIIDEEYQGEFDTFNIKY